MALFDTAWYANSVGYAAVTVRPQNTAVAAGVLRRQFTAPAVGNERVFVCIIAGTTANVADATWVLTRGARTVDGTATWQECTGASAVNGDLTNTPTWAAAKAIATAVTLGAIIQRNNSASYWICSVAGNSGASEPAWANNTAGTTQADGTVTWTCLGVVGNFTGGQAPFARLASAFVTTWFAVGNTIYIGSNHAESQATAISISLPITSLLCKVLCHNVAGSYPPAAGDLTTGATISTTAAVNITISGNGVFYCYGIAFFVAVGVNSASGSSIILGALGAGGYFENCSFQFANIGAGAGTLSVGGSSSIVVLTNCQLKFGNVGSTINLSTGDFVWRNTAPALMVGSTVPTFLFNLNSLTQYATALLEALDLSMLSTTLVNFSNSMNANILLKDCKLHASVAPGSGSARTGWSLQLVRCDSGANAYKSSRYLGEGNETTETAITRVGGAVDPNGQAQSRKIITNTLPSWATPFRAESYVAWNPTTGANVTVTVCGTINSASLPRNDDIWMEVEYLSDSGSPLGKIVTTTKANILTANAAVTSDGSSWNGGGSGAGWSPFKLVATISSPQPGMVGYIEVRVRAAKVSTTYYLDPKIVLS